MRLHKQSLKKKTLSQTKKEEKIGILFTLNSVPRTNNQTTVAQTRPGKTARRCSSTSTLEFSQVSWRLWNPVCLSVSPMSTSRDHTPKEAGRDRKLESSLSNIKLFGSPKVSEDLIQCFTGLQFLWFFFRVPPSRISFLRICIPKKNCAWELQNFAKILFFLAELYTVHGVEAPQDFLLCSHFPFISFSPATWMYPKEEKNSPPSQKKKRKGKKGKEETLSDCTQFHSRFWCQKVILALCLCNHWTVGAGAIPNWCKSCIPPAFYGNLTYQGS